MIVVWHVLQDGTTYHELGADHFDKRKGADARQRYPIRELEMLGRRVAFESAA